MRRWATVAVAGLFGCLVLLPAALVSRANAADVTTPKRSAEEEKHYVEIPLTGGGDGIKPSSAPAPSAEESKQIDALIRRLGDNDFRKREEAVTKLKELGPAAVASLKQTRDATTDPEVASRADSVIRFVERPPLPGRNSFGRGGQFNVGMSVRNGVKHVDVREPGRNVVIDEGPDGIQMAVTGDEGGKQVTRNYQAASAAELKQKNPDAFALYDRWSGAGGGRIMRLHRAARAVPPQGNNNDVEAMLQQMRRLEQMRPPDRVDPHELLDMIDQIQREQAEWRQKRRDMLDPTRKMIDQIDQHAHGVDGVGQEKPAEPKPQR